jgi:hypothetical protein
MDEHVGRMTIARGQAIYSCSCGWMGKQRSTISQARRLYEQHLNKVGLERELHHAEGRR